MQTEEFKRYTPLAAWVITIFTLLCIAGRIIGYGFLPPDDALRHAAKVVSGKSWGEILILRDGFEMDPHPGWHAILGALYHVLNCRIDTLVVLPVAGLMFLFYVTPLAWLRRPEAWLGALLVAATYAATFIWRMALGRPFVFTVAVYVALLLIWTNLRERKPRAWEILASIILIAAAAWIHGTFYQLILPAAGLVLAGRWRQAVRFGLVWAAGSGLGATFTGHPFQFLDQCVRHLFSVFGDYTLSGQLVDELRPTDGEGPTVLAVAAVLLWRSRDKDWSGRELMDPIFMMGLLGWVLGLKVSRFWWDWGLPAMLLWLALQFQSELERHVEFRSPQRLVIALGLAAAAFLGITNDSGSRWTWNASKQYLAGTDPDLAGWMPDTGGIIYSVDMTVFYDTFFKNPNAPWRYILGYESAMMPPEDLAVVHKVQWNHGELGAYEPWVKKMTPADRLILTPMWMSSHSVDQLTELEWHRAANDWWIGRLKRKLVGSTMHSQ
jgi:hypothetical protein